MSVQQTRVFDDRPFDRSALDWLLDRAKKPRVDVLASPAGRAERWRAQQQRIEAAYAALFIPARKGEKVSFTDSNMTNFVDELSLADVLAIGGDVDAHDDLDDDESADGGA